MSIDPESCKYESMLVDSLRRIEETLPYIGDVKPEQLPKFLSARHAYKERLMEVRGEKLPQASQSPAKERPAKVEGQNMLAEQLEAARNARASKSKG